MRHSLYWILPKRAAELELGVLRRAGEGDDVADVLHAGDEENQALETEAETSVRT